MEDESVLSRPSRAQDAVVAYGDGPDQLSDVRHGRGDAQWRPLVLVIHGGFWRPAYDRKHTGPMTEAIAAAGWTVAAIEYRRTPGAPDETLADVALAVERLPAQIAAHNGRVILIGHSAGGHLALWAAAQPGLPAIAGVLALAPVANLQLAHTLHLGGGAVEAFLGTSPEARADADPQRLGMPHAATTIVHGEQDDTVPLSLSESYVAAKPRTRLVPLAGVAHFAVIDPESGAWRFVMQELERLGAIADRAPDGTPRMRPR